MYYQRDVTLDTAGRPHTVCLAHVGDWASLDGLQPFTVRPSVSVRLAWGPSGGWITYADHEKGLTYTRRPDGTEFQSGVPLNAKGEGPGAYGQAIWWSGFDVQTYTRGNNVNDRTTVEVFSSAGQSVGSFDAVYAPQIHHVDPNGYPITDTDPRANITRLIRGITLYNCAEHSGWIIGHSDGNFGGVHRNVAVLVSPKLVMSMYPYATDQSPQSPRIALPTSGTFPWVALSNEDTPEPNAVPFVPFVPWEGTLDPLPGEPPPIVVEPPPVGATVTGTVVTKVMYYADGAMKTTIKTAAGALPKLKKGDTITVLKP